MSDVFSLLYSSLVALCPVFREPDMGEWTKSGSVVGRVQILILYSFPRILLSIPKLLEALIPLPVPIY